MNKYRGKRKKYVKLHIAVNIKTKQVVGFSLTPEEVQDHKEVPNVISRAGKQGKIKKAFLDRAYDNKYTYLSLKKQGIIPAIKPRETMNLEKVTAKLKNLQSKRGFHDEAYILRLLNLKAYLEDKKKWKKDNEFGERWKAEERYSIFKRIFGKHVFSKKLWNMRNEVALRLMLMNLFASLTNEVWLQEEILK